ncbi:hypothetical protein MACK_000812 [Theileria orientalis]|uniref:Uncharacterized protein n=1 Tax=Theileria orientalis TaxID=68886 RepID=A0A976MA35_THEOR|nr:hypothetical protein MACK_000812 [Theileria orientalis]
MSKEEDELDRGVLQLIYSDLELLELSINDLAIALGGKLSPVDKEFFKKLKSGRLANCFNRSVRNERNYRFYKLFKGLDLQVDSFIRIVKLHFDRGVAFLEKYGRSGLSTKLFCLCYVDVVFDLYDGVLKQMTTFSLHDCVYLYKFFIKFDNSLLSYRIKHVYIRDEIYDLILNSLWFALKDAWWLYLDTSDLRTLFPFIAHMKVEGQYQATIHDLNHVLHNIHFVTLISQDISFQSETQTIVNSPANNEDIDSLNERFEAEKGKYDNLKESDLNIKYMRSLDGLGGLGEGEAKNGVTEFEDNISMVSENQNRNSQNQDMRGVVNADLFGVHEFGKNLRELERTLESLELIGEVKWSQVVYISLVGFIYIVLFESYLNAVYESLKVGMEPKKYVEFLVMRLQDLIQVHTLMVDVDVNYTAWAHDKLGALSDAELMKCFNTYSDSLFFEEGYRDNQLFSYRGDSIKSDVKWKLGNDSRGVTMYLLAPALERLQKIQYNVVLRIASECARPVLKLIEEIYFVSESKLYYDILYNTDEFLIGPKGPLSQNCKGLPLAFKRAVFVETFFIIVKRYANKVRESATDVCEAIFFDSMSIWDSVIDYFDFPLNPEVAEEECVKLVAGVLEQIKFTPKLDLSDLDAFKRSFRKNFFTTPKDAQSMLSQYAYNCLYHVGFIRVGGRNSANDRCKGRAFGDKSDLPIGTFDGANNTANHTLNLTMDNTGYKSYEANYGSSTSTANQASGSTRPGNPNDATNTSTTFAANTGNVYLGSNGAASREYTSQANSGSNVNNAIGGENANGSVTASTTPNPNLTIGGLRLPLDGVNSGHSGGSDDYGVPKGPYGISGLCSTGKYGYDEVVGRGGYLDRYVVWLDGCRKKNMLIFGNVILFFRQNSLLQPAGFITFNSIYSIRAPNSLAQVHPSIQLLEDNSENDSFSCGTSKSSESSSNSASKEYSSPKKNRTSALSRTSNSVPLDRSNSGPAFEGVNVPAKADLGIVKRRKSPMSGKTREYCSTEAATSGNTGSPFRIRIDNKVLHLRNISKNSMENISIMKPYLRPDNLVSKLLRGKATSIARYSTISSRLSSLFEHMYVWGWQIRLELFDSCILDDGNLFNLDIEFTSPEYRRYWEQQIRDKANAKAQFISWPYHSFFFDSI